MTAQALTLPDRRYATVVIDPPWPLVPLRLSVGGITRTNKVDYPFIPLLDRLCTEAGNGNFPECNR